MSTWNGIELYAEIPKGYEPIAIREPRKGEILLHKNGEAVVADLDWLVGRAIILKRNTKPRRFVTIKFPLDQSWGTEVEGVRVTTKYSRDPCCNPEEVFHHSANWEIVTEDVPCD
jgi:hypothetical protein